MASMIIILMHPEGRHVWDAALELIFSVIMGCLLGLIITWVYHSLFKLKAPVWSTPAEPAKNSDEKEG